MEANNLELLHDYVRNRSEQAFRLIVERHINMVHAVALRQTGNAQLAEDVTQAVFIVLAEKAASIPKNTILTGWLFRATRFAAANVRRAEARREHWEQKAAQMEPTTASDSESEQIAPLLDAALEALPERDRVAILLRFFESKSMEEIGRTLGTTENAAKMRLSRAVERLRLIFRQRGVVVPAGVLLGVLTAQAAPAAPASLAGSVVALAFLKQTSVSTLPIVKGTLLLMAQTKTNTLVMTALLLLLGGTTALVVQQSLARPSPAADKAAPAQAAESAAGAKKAATAAPTKAASQVLIFRNIRSWNRHPDFEEALSTMGVEYLVSSSADMGEVDLAPYRFVIIPGAQRRDFYEQYMAEAERFNRYVTNGGTLVLELNGAENRGIVLPGGVTMASHGAVENSILEAGHPILIPYGGKNIRANYASHGYLEGLPKEALVLVAETVDGEADRSKPTFVEYPFGTGRVIAACQCFHDQDRSGRGPLMETLITYSEEKKWFKPKK